MKLHCSLPYSQQPPTYLYPEPSKVIPCPPSCFFKIHFTVILPSMPGSLQLFLSFRCYHLNPECTSRMQYNCHISSSIYPPWFELLHNIWWTVQIMKLFTKHFSPVFCYFFPPGRTVFLSQCSSNSVTDQVSHPPHIIKTVGSLESSWMTMSFPKSTLLYGGREVVISITTSCYT
jgi:hypothetical protein